MDGGTDRSKDNVSLHMNRNGFLAPFDVFNAPAKLPGFDSDQNGNSYNSVIVETHYFGPRVVNDSRLSDGRVGSTLGLPATLSKIPLQPALGYHQQPQRLPNPCQPSPFTGLSQRLAPRLSMKWEQQPDRSRLPAMEDEHIAHHSLARRLQRRPEW